MPGRYLKGAARSCAGKARFESAAEAVELTEGKYRSYRCAVCGSWHLTSHGGPVAPAKEPEKPAHPLAKLADLTWPEVPVPPPPRDEERPTRAICRGRYDREGRILLDIEGRAIRSLTVPPSQRPEFGPGITVRIAWRNGRPFIVARAID